MVNVSTYNGIYLWGSCSTGGNIVTDQGGQVFNVKAYLNVQAAETAAQAVNGTVYFPSGSYTLPSAITVSGNVSFSCEAGTTIVSANNTAIFTFSGTVNYLRVDNCVFNATGTTASVANLSTASNSAEGRIVFQNNTFNNFNLGIKYGPSTYFTYIQNNRFNVCATALYIDINSDGIVEGNFFAYFPTSPLGGQIYYRGANVTIHANTFIPANISTTTPDIYIEPTGNPGQGGYLWITENKFGSEANEVNKI